ncbi:MAG: hypothetical protein HYZ48_03605 [Chlamydiales bacterium]|nr:hypothetical protein [Chlamydiales bacterium]
MKLIGKKTLYIDYQLRMPILFLEDFPNVLIDEKGYLFPLSPFFTPKKFPSLYLGKTFFNSLKSTSLWKTSLKGREIDVALTLHHLLEEKRKIAPFTVERIDLSCMYTDSLGKREIILVLKNKEGSFHFLRLQPRKLGKQLDNYFLLRSKLLKGKSQVIDLRIPKSAFISDV